MSESIALPNTAPAPIRLDWCNRAAALPGKTLHLAMALFWLGAECREASVILTRRTLRAWGISRDARYDALRRLRGAALIRSWQAPGRAPLVVTMIAVLAVAPSRWPRPGGRPGGWRR
ncbi:hypothetical protein [uncultured Lamprocystis sp.]|uniref:hypothetical protein n=1 Tax=uncultured Lamprocystis sp. TaxID=543132 RepID=UPI0025D33F6B|nr:hypothetical protein [uncultured Lamprocystis sp.]